MAKAKLTGARPPSAAALSMRRILMLTAVLAVCLALLNLSPQVLHGEFSSAARPTQAADDERQQGAAGEGAADTQQVMEAQQQAQRQRGQQRQEQQQAGAQEAAAGEEVAEQQRRQAALATVARQVQRQLPGTAGEGGAQQAASGPGTLDKYHVVMSTSVGIYTQWQSRVCYYWFKKAKQADKHGAMGGFTRLLSGRELDGLEQEIPTVLVDPLPPELEKLAHGYVVLERPHAFQQWARRHLASLPERYILMAEPDHIFLQAPPLWATPTRPAAFPFFYITPSKYPEITGRFNAKNISLDQMDGVGNSPVMIHRDQFASIVDMWVDLAFKIKADVQANGAWGWVQEMYAYSIASSQAPGGPIRYELHPELMLQPPWDNTLKTSNGKDAYIIHFTYGNDFDDHGRFTPGKVGTWHLDKRDYTDRYPPRDIPLPPAGCRNLCVIELVKRLNEAAQSLPDWEPRRGPAATTVRRRLLGAPGDGGRGMAAGSRSRGGSRSR